MPHDYSKTLLKIGQADEDSSGIYVTAMRASTKPTENWRARLQRETQGEGQERRHHRVWLLGDAIHAMQPNRYGFDMAKTGFHCRLSTEKEAFTNCHIQINRGMGGNQAMHDCTEILPYLVELNDIAQSGRPPIAEEISTACAKYEAAMIDRSFNWVWKGGGVSMLVGDRLIGSLKPTKLSFANFLCPKTSQTFDFDGVLGKSISIASKLCIPVVSTFLRLPFMQSSLRSDWSRDLSPSNA